MDEKQLNEFEERDATLEPDEEQQGMTDDELQESILEDSGMNGFQKFIARMDEKKWKLCQRITGVVLGALACTALFVDSSESQSTFSYGLIIAIVIALIVPNILEKQGQRKLNSLRMTMALTMGVLILGYFLYSGITTGFSFKA